MFNKNFFGFGGYSGTDMALAAGAGFVGGVLAAKAASDGYLGQTAQGLFSGEEVAFGSSVEAFGQAVALRRNEAKADKAKAEKAEKDKAVAMTLDQAIAYEDHKAAQAVKAIKDKLEAKLLAAEPTKSDKKA
jgi:hypothetical protein